MVGTIRRENVSVASVVVKLIVFLSAAVGVIHSVSSGDEMMGAWKSLMYYTLQSNVITCVVTAVFLTLELETLSGREVRLPRWLEWLRFIEVCGITLTLLVFWALLMPSLPPSYLVSIDNLTLHTATPILAILDFIVFGGDFVCGGKKICIVWIEPVYYLIFAMACSFSGVRFSGGSIVPYFFLNYEQLGWFTIGKTGIGVVYWVLIMFVLMFGIGSAIMGLHKLYLSKEKKQR